MYKYRVVQLVNGDYVVRKRKKGFLSFLNPWITIDNLSIDYFKTKEAAIAFVDDCINTDRLNELWLEGLEDKKVIIEK